MYRDFFIVLDLRLIKIGSLFGLPFSFLGSIHIECDNDMTKKEVLERASFFVVFGNTVNILIS
ncbi:hypothetical protein D0T49_05920 [Paludibacter sp. 221]|nr:hypothetical protein [Paludibacter sp. 221]